MLKYLKQQKIKFNFSNAENKCLWHYIAQCPTEKQQQMIEFFEPYIRYINIYNYHSEPLIYALKENKINLFKYFSRYIQLNTKKHYKASILHIIFSQQKWDLLDHILKLKAFNIGTVTDSRNYTLLHLAVQYNSLDKLELLLSTNLDRSINALAGSQKRTALHMAVEHNRPAMIKKLLAKGAEKNLKDVNGKTAAELIHTSDKFSKQQKKQLVEAIYHPIERVKYYDNLNKAIQKYFSETLKSVLLVKKYFDKNKSEARGRGLAVKLALLRGASDSSVPLNRAGNSPFDNLTFSSSIFPQFNSCMIKNSQLCEINELVKIYNPKVCNQRQDIVDVLLDCIIFGYDYVFLLIFYMFRSHKITLSEKDCKGILTTYIKQNLDEVATQNIWKIVKYWLKDKILLLALQIDANYNKDINNKKILIDKILTEIELTRPILTAENEQANKNTLYYALKYAFETKNTVMAAKLFFEMGKFNLTTQIDELINTESKELLQLLIQNSPIDRQFTANKELLQQIDLMHKKVDNNLTTYNINKLPKIHHLILFAFNNKCDHWQCAVSASNIEEKSILQLERLSNIHQDSRGCNALHYAVMFNKINFVEKLAENSALLTRTDRLGNTPLHYATKLGYLDIAKVLVDKGKNALLTKVNSQGDTVLHQAIKAVDLDTVEYLVKHGGKALLQISNNEGNAPLHYAVKLDDIKITQYLTQCLVKFNLDINTINNAGKSVLACSLGANKDYLQKNIQTENALQEPNQDLEPIKNKLVIIDEHKPNSVVGKENISDDFVNENSQPKGKHTKINIDEKVPMPAKQQRTTRYSLLYKVGLILTSTIGLSAFGVGVASAIFVGLFPGGMIFTMCMLGLSLAILAATFAYSYHRHRISKQQNSSKAELPIIDKALDLEGGLSEIKNDNTIVLTNKFKQGDDANINRKDKINSSTSNNIINRGKNK